MFTHLPLEIRLLIWETILHQPRIVYINMRYMADDPTVFGCGSNDEGSHFQCLCSTPIPVLLHLCTETRTLALAHYELTFGRANAPVLRPRGVYKHGFSIKGKEYETIVESNEAEVEKYSPKIYFNFEHDTVVFGRTLLPRGEEPKSWRFMACFPYGNHFNFELLQRIESLVLSLDTDLGHLIFNYLNRHVGSGSFQRLKKLYLCLEADDLDLSRGVELVDFGGKVKEEEGDEEMAQKFVDRWRTAFKGEDVLVNSGGMEGLRIICREGLSRRHRLRELLLKNGASPDEVLKCVWMRDIGWGN